MKQLKSKGVLVLVTVFSLVSASAQETSSDKEMKSFLIERDIPKAGEFTEADLKGISQKSCSVLEKMKGIVWVNSYVTGDKVFCVYQSNDTDLIKEHAEKAGFPVTSIMEIGSVIGPKTAN
ncbi:MAG: DUF4242 domain-containing protein [Allomuricauda sp.]